MKSKFVEQFVQMGVEKGIEKGQTLATQKSRAYLFEVLQEQFQQIPDDLRANIDNVTDQMQLLQLLTVVSRCSTLEQFRTKVGL